MLHIYIYTHINYIHIHDILESIYIYIHSLIERFPMISAKILDGEMVMVLRDSFFSVSEVCKESQVSIKGSKEDLKSVVDELHA